VTDSRPYFDDVAARWDEMRASFFSEKLREKALEAAAPAVGTLAADLGAGTGFMTEGLLKRGVRVLAVDQSQAMLDVLVEKLSGFQGLECRLGDAGRLPIEDGLADSVFANMYLHHVENPARAIAEMARILAPGGVLVITDLDQHDFEFLRAEQHDRWLGFAREDVTGWLDAAGLQDASVACIGENCCSDSRCSDQSARVSVFIARGRKG
jgi:ubiquinone/menaquinone biosynthesis C-methylase UbiE